MEEYAYGADFSGDGEKVAVDEIVASWKSVRHSLWVSIHIRAHPIAKPSAGSMSTSA